MCGNRDLLHYILLCYTSSMTRGEHYLSKEKYEELVHEADHLKTVRRKEIAESLEYAKQLGDLSENAEYQEAREAQAKTEDRIATLENILKGAVLIEEHHSAFAELGSTVVVRKKGDGGPTRYSIVGSEEANVKEGKISNESPLGMMLLEKKKGDTFEVMTPKGPSEYTIVDIV